MRNGANDHGDIAELIAFQAEALSQKLQALRQTSVNRLSIGIQSFFDEDLLWMNRVHKGHEAESSVKRAQDAGFENITADLIYGYPLLTDQKWKFNFEKIFTLDIPHVSSYTSAGIFSFLKFSAIASTSSALS